MLLNTIDWLFYDLAGLNPEVVWIAALHFFVYDTVKIFLLLAVMIFLIGVGRSFLPESTLRRWMGSRGPWGYVIAAVFGAVTPFCSCSSIPIFISLLKAGVPLGVTFSFLITSPIINEYLVILLANSFGIPITIAYVASGLTIGIGAGMILNRLHLDQWLEKDLLAPSKLTAELAMAGPGSASPDGEMGETAPAKAPALTWAQRLRIGYDEAATIIRQIWVWVLVGVAIGAAIHNFVPRESLEGIMAATGIFSVPLATLLGVPLYGSCAAIVPVAVALFDKGIPLGTALAFMMAMAALSIPEAVMLRRVIRLPLIGLFFGITTIGIMLVGYLLNLLSALGM